ncbi:MAG: DUF262 domain-containing protein [Roseburia sp.]|nr:DUF262 domain-containing protein [Roseburia sp.]MCM1277562.1 DUF262 domain-containing protein [Robinsoniella sp.]
MKWESYSHPISDIRDWNSNNRLELRPDFQRNEVWSRAAQIMLIDTIIQGIPIPKVYIKSVMNDGKTYRIVIDGQQRLTAILKFVQNEFPLKKPYAGEYQNKKFNELPDDVQNEILRYKIDIDEIFNPTDEEIRDLYSRVNKYTVQLNKQELRRADFPGDFISLAEELAENKFFEQAKIFSVKQRRRMLDVEYVEELLTILLKGIQDKRDYLDSVCEEFICMENKADVVSDFLGIIDDIVAIFDPEIMPIHATRFKQKSDFYSLFACIFALKKIAVIEFDNLSQVRRELQEICDKVGPQSEDDIYRKYATCCLSDANSIANRKWRVDFIKERLEIGYKRKE